jgi:hypothetical protein
MQADRMERLEIANKLLATLPTPPQLYIANGKLHLFVDRRNTGFRNIDLLVRVNPGNGYLMASRTGHKHASVPWGGTQERFIASVASWADEGWKWRDGYFESMVAEHGHWLNADAVRYFKEAIGMESAQVACPLCHHVHVGRCEENAPNAQFTCACSGPCMHGKDPAYCRQCVEVKP